MTDLRTAAQQALEYMKSIGQMDMYPEDWAIVGRLEAALAQQAEHFCDTHCTWLDHAAGCVRAEPVEPVAKVELMTTGGNAGLATRIVEIDDHLRERLRPGQLLYTAPPQQAEPVQEPVAWQDTAKPTELVCAEHWENIDPVWHSMYRPLYTAPPQRKPLTQEEAATLVVQDNRMRGEFSAAMELIRRTERAHNIKE